MPKHYLWQINTHILAWKRHTFSIIIYSQCSLVLCSEPRTLFKHFRLRSAKTHMINNTKYRFSIIRVLVEISTDFSNNLSDNGRYSIDVYRIWWLHSGEFRWSLYNLISGLNKRLISLTHGRLYVAACSLSLAIPFPPYQHTLPIKLNTEKKRRKKKYEKLLFAHNICQSVVYVCNGIPAMLLLLYYMHVWFASQNPCYFINDCSL